MKFKNVDKKSLFLVVISVILMGLSLSFINQTNFGTDPCTLFNLGMAAKLGLSLGNWQAIFNCILLVIVFIYDRKQIGWGTIVNMFLVGYSFDFFTWVNSLWIPVDFYSSLVVRICVIIPALFIFVVAASTYIAVQLGTGPYDAVPFILAAKLHKVSFKVVRISWDLTVSLLGFLLGSTIGPVTIVMAFALGPVISWIRVHVIERILHTEEKKDSPSFS